MPTTAVRTTPLPSGEAVPVLGQGTWGMGEDRNRRAEEIAALRLGLDLGMRLIDTAEMYGAGGAEEVVAEAIEGRRDDVFLISKVLPHHATRPGTVAACRASLKRLRTARLDLYLLHWRGSVPLEETLAGFDELARAGDIRHWGVSNLDVPDLKELIELEGGDDVATDQVLYNLARRGIEYDLMPWCSEKGIPLIAYSPIDQGSLLTNPAIRRVAMRRKATTAQVALAWVLKQSAVIAIPKASHADHVRENHGALEIHLTREDLAELDHEFRRPARRVPLEMI